MKVKLILFNIIALGLCSCTSSQIAQEENNSQSIETRSITAKSVKEYVESGEFIDVIPEEGTQYIVSRSVQEEKEHLNQMMAVMYRFYKHCNMDEAGIITCNISSGKDINASEEAFEMRIKEMNSWNDGIRDKIRNGVKYKVIRIDDEYFKNLLKFK